MKLLKMDNTKGFTGSKEELEKLEEVLHTLYPTLRRNRNSYDEKRLLVWYGTAGWDYHLLSNIHYPSRFPAKEALKEYKILNSPLYKALNR